MSWIAPELRPLSAVVAATLACDGTLIEANAGFLRIARLPAQQLIGAPAARAFVQPSFAALLRLAPAADDEIHRGLLTMGDPMAATRTLHGRVWRRGGQLQVLAEYDIDELERLNAKMIELNRDYADAQFELAQSNIKLQQREAEIVALTLTDSLTGLGNHRRFEQELSTEIKRFARTAEPLSALMVDLDHFKAINDSYGHDAGDKVLAAFAALLRAQIRATEIAARIGGEEFVVLMPHTGLQQAMLTAERIRTALAAVPIPPASQPVTASFGVATLATAESRDAFMRRVDCALYAAKHSGRNCVVAG
ncbi:GGDEF domain-containing protein [Rhodopseudomonas palustris]|uniref:diguanylate cyclase n=1 Tax=Rhodopseudomonas palustris (strain BisB18) TaxID=316056 RepID=Q219A8_RHOPB